MKKQYIYSALILTAVLCAGCAKEFENTTDERDGSAIELSSVSTDPMTKAVITGTEFTTSEAEAGIGLFLLDGSGNAYGSNPANVKYYHSGSKWVADSPLRVGGTAGTLYGYYPYSSTVTDITAIPVASSVNGTDYLYGSIAEITSAKAKSESLTLSHALTRLRITFKLDKSFVGSGVLSSLTIEGDGIAASGTLDATTGKITATKSTFTVSGLNASISTGLTEDCLIVPASASDTPQAVTLKFTVDGKAYKVDLTDGLAVKLQSGIQTDITLTVKNTSVTVDGSSIGAWGDGGSQTVTVGGDYKVTVKLSDAAEDAGIADNLTVQCKPESNSVKVEVYSKAVKPLVIRIGDNTRIIPDKDANFCTFTISDITSDITATLAYAKTFRVTESIVPDVTPAGGYLDNIGFSGIGNIPEGRTVTVKVSKTVPGYHTKMVCDGRTVTGDTIVLEDISKNLEVSAHYEFYDYPLPGVFTVADDGEGNVRKVKFARGNMWCQNHVLHNEDEQYQFSSADWALDGHISHFMWSKSLTESVKQKYGDSGTTSSDNFFTNAGDDHLSPNPDLIVNGQKGLWRVLSGGDNGEWNYLLNKRSSEYHRYAEVKVNDMPGLLIFPDTFTWPSGAGAEPENFDTACSNWNGVNYQDAAFLTLQAAGCVFLPAAGYRDGYVGNSIIYNVGSFGYYWSSTPFDDDSAYSLYFYSGIVNPANDYARFSACAVRLVTESN